MLFSKPMPARDWRRHSVDYLLHVLLGLAAALSLGLDTWAVYGVLGTAIFLTYQVVEFLRRGDTPARDIFDFALGWGAGLGCTLLLHFWEVYRYA